MKEFKLNCYFAMYKDVGISNKSKFRNLFEKKHGTYDEMSNLIRMIDRYQISKYGQTLR